MAKVLLPNLSSGHINIHYKEIDSFNYCAKAICNIIKTGICYVEGYEIPTVTNEDGITFIGTKELVNEFIHTTQYNNYYTDDLYIWAALYIISKTENIPFHEPFAGHILHPNGYSDYDGIKYEVRTYIIQEKYKLSDNSITHRLGVEINRNQYGLYNPKLHYSKEFLDRWYDSPSPFSNGSGPRRSVFDGWTGCGGHDIDDGIGWE